METGAVIVAAGMSTRMAQYKQLMKIGDLAMAERVIVNFQQAGVKEIVMVTGHRASELEAEFGHYNITFLRNENYETTEMFDSAKIGLSYLKGRCRKILFCPADIPFFQDTTVALLLRQKGDIIQPDYQGKADHPIVINASYLPDIIRYQGEGGLKGALGSLKDAVRVRIPVEDEAVLMDADTKEEFHRLVELHHSRQMQARR